MNLPRMFCVQRAPLEQIILKVKVLDLGAPKAILALAIQPPDVRAIEIQVLILKEVSRELHVECKYRNEIFKFIVTILVLFVECFFMMM